MYIQQRILNYLLGNDDDSDCNSDNSNKNVDSTKPTNKIDNNRNKIIDNSGSCGSGKSTNKIADNRNKIINNSGSCGSGKGYVV